MSWKRPTHTVQTTWRFAFRRLRALVTHPIFGILTLFGNGFVALSSFAMYHIEHGTNPTVREPIDAVWWAFSTVTTVGYGDIVPVTFWGRVIGMLTMIVGTSLFWSFTALFATVLLEKEIEQLERDIGRVKKHDGD